MVFCWGGSSIGLSESVDWVTLAMVFVERTAQVVDLQPLWRRVLDFPWDWTGKGFEMGPGNPSLIAEHLSSKMKPLLEPVRFLQCVRDLAELQRHLPLWGRLRPTSGESGQSWRDFDERRGHLASLRRC